MTKTILKVTSKIDEGKQPDDKREDAVEDEQEGKKGKRRRMPQVLSCKTSFSQRRIELDSLLACFLFCVFGLFACMLLLELLLLPFYFQAFLRTWCQTTTRRTARVSLPWSASTVDAR